MMTPNHMAAIFDASGPSIFACQMFNNRKNCCFHTQNVSSGLNWLMAPRVEHKKHLSWGNI